MRKFAAAFAVALTAFCVQGLSASDIKSGLQVDEPPPAFNVTDITGPAAGEGKLCYRCKYGARPVVSIFVRKIDENTAKLVKELDAIVAKNVEDKKMAAFVTVLTEDPDAHEAELKKVADEQKIKHTPLTVFENAVGPTSYKINEKADVTVMMWVENNVKVNHAFAEGELTSEAIEAVIKDTAKILD
jgi:hypothetical protein